jgi:hypothetical protein
VPRSRGVETGQSSRVFMFRENHSI